MSKKVATPAPKASKAKPAAPAKKSAVVKAPVKKAQTPEEVKVIKKEVKASTPELDLDNITAVAMLPSTQPQVVERVITEPGEKGQFTAEVIRQTPRYQPEPSKKVSFSDINFRAAPKNKANDVVSRWKTRS